MAKAMSRDSERGDQKRDSDRSVQATKRESEQWTLRGGLSTESSKAKQRRQRAELTTGSIEHQELEESSLPIEESVRIEHHSWLFPL